MSLQNFCIRVGTSRRKKTSRYPNRPVTGGPWRCSRHMSVPCTVIGSKAGSPVGAPAWACNCPIGNPGFLTTLELDDHTRPGDRGSRAGSVSGQVTAIGICSGGGARRAGDLGIARSRPRPRAARLGLSFPVRKGRCTPRRLWP